MNIISLGLSPFTAHTPVSVSIASSYDREAGRITLQLTRARTNGPAQLAMSAFTLDGGDARNLLGAPAENPELAEMVLFNAAPSDTSSVRVAQLAQTLEIGALYLVSYEVLSSSPLTRLFFAGADCPFDFQPLASEVGVHDVLVTATRDSATSLMRALGEIEFGFISCRKAEWTIDLPLAAPEGELSDTIDGQFSGADAIVATTTESLTSGENYVLSYEILETGGTAELFSPANGPFGYRQIPSAIGVHNVLLTCVDTDINPFLHINGDLTFGSISLRREQLEAGRRISWEISVGGVSQAGEAFTPAANEIHVSVLGSDKVGTGAALSPFKSPEYASSVAKPGDTIYLHPGVYSPFEVINSGTAGLPITITTRPGEERQAIVRGDLMRHVVYGGTGVAQNNATRDGIRIAGKNHITIRGLRVEHCWRNGIFIIGNGQNTITGNHIIENCFFQHTGQSGIFVCGERSDSPVAADDAYRTRHITIRNNEVTKTNVVTDYNNVVTNSFGEPGGVGEAVTVANSVQFVFTYGNNVHNSRQYGIDYKNHVADGEIHSNRIDHVIRYGIYLDAGETDVRRIRVFDNIVTHCRAGIVLAREEDGDDSGDGLVFEDIDIDNNTLAHLSRTGIHFQRHPVKDQQDIGHIRRIRARFNTLYNTNTDGIYRDISIDDWASFGVNQAGEQIVGDIELSGNVAWNPDGQMRMRVDVDGDPRFIVERNFNVVDGSTNGVDPLFKDPAAHDFSLQETSPALAVIQGPTDS